MIGMLKRTWFDAAERDRRIISSVLREKRLALMDKENAEADALLRRLRDRSTLARQRLSAPSHDRVRQR